ncbi:MAG: hypothetical protein E6344_14400 [Clostridium sp.]|nr:hypothetical protein [Clostridium sp.]MDU7084883.1 hypothetical protein [Clostridium sp.]
MNNYKLIFLPQVGDSSSMEDVLTTQDEIQEKYPCPCCEKNTIPNRGDALAQYVYGKLTYSLGQKMNPVIKIMA